MKRLFSNFKCDILDWHIPEDKAIVGELSFGVVEVGLLVDRRNDI